MIPGGWLEWNGEREGEFLMADGRRVRNVTPIRDIDVPVAWRPIDEKPIETADLSTLKRGIR